MMSLPALLVVVAAVARAQPVLDWARDPVAQTRAPLAFVDAVWEAKPEAQYPDMGMTAEQLACQPDVIAGFKAIWAKATSGMTRYEGALRVDLVGDRRSIWIAPMTFEDHKTHVTIVENTVAIAHTHPNDRSAPRPSPQDELSPVPNFVVSQSALWVTDPRAHSSRLVRSEWRKPCRKGR